MSHDTNRTLRHGHLALLAFLVIALGRAGAQDPAPAPGPAEGTLQLSSPFFVENGRIYGPDDEVRVSGVVPFVPVEASPFGLAAGGAVGEGPEDTVPLADIYVMPADALAPGAALADATGSPTRVTGTPSGEFSDVLVAQVNPTGALPAGPYMVVMDQCLDGVYDPGVDLVLGLSGYAFEAVLPRVLEAPPGTTGSQVIALNRLKHAAVLMGAELFNTLPVIADDLAVLAANAATAEALGPDSTAVATDMAAAMAAGWEQSGEGWLAVSRDPPDPLHELAPLGAIPYDHRAGGPLPRLANAMVEQAALVNALLMTLERTFGAISAEDFVARDFQLSYLHDLAGLLGGAGDNLLRTYAGLEALDIALRDDAFAGSAEATRLRAVIPGVRRAIAGLIDPLGPRFFRVIIPTLEPVLPMGLQAWVEWTTQLLPATVVGQTTGPYAAVPGRVVQLDASASFDREGGPVALAWDLDADGEFDDGAGAQVQHAFTDPGDRLVGLRATDQDGFVDFHYVLFRVGDPTRTEILVRRTDVDFLVVRPDGSMHVLFPYAGPDGGGQALRVAPDGTIYMRTETPGLSRFSPDGTLLGTLTEAQISAMTGVPIDLVGGVVVNISNNAIGDFVLDGRGDLIVSVRVAVWPSVYANMLVRVAHDFSTAEVIPVRELTLPNGVVAFIASSMGPPGLAIDPEGNIVLAGATSPGVGNPGHGGILTVDPADASWTEVVPSHFELRSGRQIQVWPFFEGQWLAAFTAGGLGSFLDAGVEVTTGGDYILRTQFLFFRVPVPPVLNVIAQDTGFIRYSLDVAQPILGTAVTDPPLPPAAITDFVLDGGGDVIAVGSVPGSGRHGVWRIAPDGSPFEIFSWFTGQSVPGGAGAVDIAPEVRTVTPKDIERENVLAPRVRLSGLALDQTNCPESVDLSLTVTSEGPGDLAEPFTVHVFDGDPLGEGEAIGSFDVNGLAQGESQTLALEWMAPMPGPHEIFATTPLAPVHVAAFQVCLPHVLPPAIRLDPADDTKVVGSPHTAIATVEDILGNPVPGMALVFDAGGANTASGAGTTDAQGRAPFTYTGTSAGRDMIVVTGAGGALQAEAGILWQSANEPPVADAGPDVTISSQDQASTSILGAGSDPDGDALTCRWLEGATVLSGPDAVADGSCPLGLGTLPPLSLGTHNLTLEVSDGMATATDVMVLRVLNTPPEADPTGAGTYEIGPLSVVTLGGAVRDFDGDDLVFQWRRLDVPLFPPGEITPPEGGGGAVLPDNVVGTQALGLGTHVIDLGVRDPVNPEVVEPVVVEIIDTTPPSLSTDPSGCIEWPPNHKWEEMAIQVATTDNSGGAVTLSVEVESSEPPEDLGDGNFQPDFEILEVNQETGLVRVKIRTERSGLGEGRTYTITITATDESGNRTTTVVTCVVPHDQSKKEKKEK